MGSGVDVSASADDSRCTNVAATTSVAPTLAKLSASPRQLAPCTTGMMACWRLAMASSKAAAVVTQAAPGVVQAKVRRACRLRSKVRCRDDAGRNGLVVMDHRAPFKPTAGSSTSIRGTRFTSSLIFGP